MVVIMVGGLTVKVKHPVLTAVCRSLSYLSIGYPRSIQAAVPPSTLTTSA